MDPRFYSPILAAPFLPAFRSIITPHPRILSSIKGREGSLREWTFFALSSYNQSRSLRPEVTSLGPHVSSRASSYLVPPSGDLCSGVPALAGPISLSSFVPLVLCPSFTIHHSQFTILSGVSPCPQPARHPIPPPPSPMPPRAGSADALVRSLRPRRTIRSPFALFSHSQFSNFKSQIPHIEHRSFIIEHLS